VQSVSDELRGEKIDLIPWSQDLAAHRAGLSLRRPAGGDALRHPVRQRLA